MKQPKFNGPNSDAQENATVYLHEERQVQRIYVDNDGDGWWRGASGAWRRFWLQPGDVVERD